MRNKSDSFTLYELTEEWVVRGIHFQFRKSKDKFSLIGLKFFPTFYGTLDARNDINLKTNYVEI